MKKLTLLLLITGHYTMAQLPTQQIATPFDRFISRPSIEWAAYINDTISFDKVNLNKLLLDRLIKNEIRASLPVGSGNPETAQIKYLDKKGTDKLRFEETLVAVFDSLGNPAGERRLKRDRVDPETFTVTFVTQVLYIENGKLSSYIPWVSPMTPVVTSTGIQLGYGNFFSTGFNDQYNLQPAKGAAMKWLAHATRTLRLDTVQRMDKLKELYGRNLVESLWPHILKGKYEMADANSGKKLLPQDLNSELIYGKMVVPVYDMDGNVKGQKAVANPILPGIFSSIELLQDWYYDQSRNKVFSSIREMTLYTRSGDGQDPQEKAVIRLVSR